MMLFFTHTEERFECEMAEKTSAFGGTNYYRFLSGVVAGCDVMCLRDPFCNAAAVVTSSLDESEIGCYTYKHEMYTDESRTGSTFWEQQCPSMSYHIQNESLKCKMYFSRYLLSIRSPLFNHDFTHEVHRFIQISLCSFAHL